VSGAGGTSLIDELKNMADRGIDRVFEVGKRTSKFPEGRPRLDNLFEIVRDMQPRRWAGTEFDKVQAIKWTMREAIKGLPEGKMPRAKVEWRDAALTLYDLCDIDLAIEMKIREAEAKRPSGERRNFDQRYPLLVAIVQHKAGPMGQRTFERNVTPLVRVELARRLEAHGCSKIMMGRVCFGFVTRGVSGW
jgi:hypothetical protein